MIIGLIDNGSLEAAAHRRLRALASVLSDQSGASVHALSWKHSDRVPAASLDGKPGETLAPFVRRHAAAGERSFLFVPFFISPQGAIGSALRRDLELLQTETGGFDFNFTTGLSDSGALATIIAERVREVSPATVPDAPVVLVDHGGPSSASAGLRDRLAAEAAALLSRPVHPCSMEGEHPPLLADLLSAAGFANRDVIVAQLFLSPGRHAGPGGDIEEICRASPARCHRTALVGDHPRAAAILSAAIRRALSSTIN